ncbi:hypothetical protein T439DRAFT_354386 [Meredithblackwellia eburnea MCA 4105]
MSCSNILISKDHTTYPSSLLLSVGCIAIAFAIATMTTALFLSKVSSKISFDKGSETNAVVGSRPSCRETSDVDCYSESEEEDRGSVSSLRRSPKFAKKLNFYFTDSDSDDSDLEYEADTESDVQVPVAVAVANSLPTPTPAPAPTPAPVPVPVVPVTTKTECLACVHLYSGKSGKYPYPHDDIYACIARYEEYLRTRPDNLDKFMAHQRKTFNECFPDGEEKWENLCANVCRWAMIWQGSSVAEMEGTADVVQVVGWFWRVWL